MVTVMAVMFCVTLLSIAALSAAQGDLKPGAHDKSRKVAYAAAEAGVQNYLFHLSQDPNYWAKCTTGAAAARDQRPVERRVAGRRSAPLGERPRLDAARYTIELLPANGAAACSTADPGHDDDRRRLGHVQGPRDGPGRHDRHQALARRDAQAQELPRLPVLHRQGGAQPGALRDVPRQPHDARERRGRARRHHLGAAAVPSLLRATTRRVGNRAGQFFDGELPRTRRRGTWANFDLLCKASAFQRRRRHRRPRPHQRRVRIDCGSPAPKLGDSIDDAVETSGLGQIPTTPANPDGGWHGCSAPDVNFSTTSPARPVGTWKARAAPLTLPADELVAQARHRGDIPLQGRRRRSRMHGTTMRVTGTREDGTVLSALGGRDPRRRRRLRRQQRLVPGLHGGRLQRRAGDVRQPRDRGRLRHERDVHRRERHPRQAQPHANVQRARRSCSGSSRRTTCASTTR